MIILSKCSNPFIDLTDENDFLFIRPGEIDKILNIVSIANELFPEPDTPVTHEKLPIGIFKVTFFRSIDFCELVWYRKATLFVC